jgi:hypothetical protein
MALPVRLIAALLTVLTLVGLFGIIDVSVVFSPGEFRPLMMLEAGWGLLFTVFVAGAFLAVAARPRRCTAPLVQIGAVVVALAAAAALGADGRLGLLAIGLALALIVLAALLPGDREPLWPPPGITSWPLAALTVAGAVPWLWYGTSMFLLARQPSALTDVTLGISHYPVQGALAVALVGLAGLTARWPRFRSWIGISAGIVAAALGASDLAYPHSAGAFPVGWAVCAILWGVLIVGTSRMSRDRLEPQRR